LSEQGYLRVEVPGQGVTFEADRLRRDKQELIGELLVRCTLAGAQTIHGTDHVISIADFNFSSARSRSDRAKLLRERARTNGDLDWAGLLEEFCLKVHDSEREGDPAIDLSTLPKPGPREDWNIGGIVYPKHHPTILFGDGGSAKSYLALWLAGRMWQMGMKIGYFDWELSADEHRYRLEMLFGQQLPRIQYVRCDRALIHESDRLRKVTRDHKLDFAFCDSIAFACDGPPESAEIAGKYFRAIREIGIGTLHIAHITKGENADRRPFGCYSEDTEVLTRRGWIPHSAVTLDDSVACFNLESETLQWEQPEQIHKYEYCGDMVHFDGASMDILVTPNHRMVVQQQTSAGGHGWGKKWKFRQAGSIAGSTMRIPASAKLKAAPAYDPGPWFATFLGWWIAEGCLDGNAPVLTQHTGPVADRMKACVKQLGFDFNVWIGKSRPHELDVMQLRIRAATDLGRWLREKAGSGAKNKKIPMECFDWKQEHQELLFLALMEGDGHWVRIGKSGNYTTISKQLADDVQRLAIQLGWTSRIRMDVSKWGPRYSVLIGSRKTLEFRKSRHLRKVSYSGFVYCLTVPTGAYVTRRNGYAIICGNSAFWHNGARSTWYIQASEENEPGYLEIGLFNRKANLGSLNPEVSYAFEFGENRTVLHRKSVSDNPDLAKKLSTKKRLRTILLSGSQTLSELAELLDVQPDSIRRTVDRNRKDFIKLGADRIGLLGHG
jgi:hypothetical protein